jgi:hypothetical protein
VAISDDAVRELHNQCDLPMKECRAALEEHGGDVEAALAALIDAGRVETAQLNPDTVSDANFNRAARRQQLESYRKMLSGGGAIGQLLSKLANPADSDDKNSNQPLEDLRKSLGGLMAAKLGEKTPEQLLEEDEQHKAEKFKKLKAIMPGMADAKPLTPGQSARIHQRVARRSAYLAAHPVTLKLPPFPPLKMTLSEWEGKDVLPSWAGSQERLGGYTSQSSAKPSKGKISLQMPRLDESDANPRPPAPEQIAAYSHLKEQGDDVTAVVLQALLKAYKKIRRQWLKDLPDLELPVIDDIDEMKQNVGVGIVHLHDIVKDGFAYIGLELGCTWDEEHGAGVLIHKSRVVAVGQGDTSFDDHAATKDGGTRLPHESQGT